MEAEDEGRCSIAQDTLRNSTDFLGRFLAQSGGAGGVTSPYVCPHCHCFPLEDYTWWVSAGQKPCSWWCAACGGQYDWRAPNRILVIQDSTDHREAKVSRAHSAHQKTRENSTNALKLLTNQQKDGDSPVGTVVAGLLERSRSSIVDGLRRFISEDNHEAVKVGDVHRETRSKTVVKPNFKAPAVIREGAGELTSRAREEGVLRPFSGTSNVGDQRWEASAGRRGLARLLPGYFPEWEATYRHNKYLHQAVKKQEIWTKQKCRSAVGPERSQRQRCGLL